MQNSQYLDKSLRTEQEAQLDKVNKLLEELADDLRSEVKRIEEKSVPLYKDNYGEYMNLITILANDAGSAKIIAAALKKAGANVAGVDAAMMICYRA